MLGNTLAQLVISILTLLSQSALPVELIVLITAIPEVGIRNERTAIHPAGMKWLPIYLHGGW